jgi:nucleotide-binding universal stress UspA family protein
MISILATVDGSPEALAVVPFLEKLTADLNAKIHLLTVVERPKATPRRRATRRAAFAGVPAVPGGTIVPQMMAPPEPRWQENDDQAIQRAIAEGRDFLEDASGPLKERGLQIETDVVVDGDVAKAIVDYASREGFDLIAMATHGRGGLSDLVQGSVASAVVRSGVAPVLLVRPSKAAVRKIRATTAKRRGAREAPAT